MLYNKTPPILRKIRNHFKYDIKMFDIIKKNILWQSWNCWYNLVGTGAEPIALHV